jgi:hypothetical protein
MPGAESDDLVVDLSDGPNPIGTALLRREPVGGYVRELFGLGERELVAGVAPDAVHDPVPPRKRVAELGRSLVGSTVLAGLGGQAARQAGEHELAEAGRSPEVVARARELYRVSMMDYPTALATAEREAMGPATRTGVILQGLVSATPTGSINLRLRRQS